MLLPPPLLLVLLLLLILNEPECLHECNQLL